MSTFTLIHDAPSTPRLALHSLWHVLRGRFEGFTSVPVSAGPLGQAETALYARGMLGWRG